jgi:hypothetical protein
MELSDAWINEAREVPKAILDGLTGPGGRFPPTKKDSEEGAVRVHRCRRSSWTPTRRTRTTGGIASPRNPAPRTSRTWARSRTSCARSARLRADQPLYEWFAQPGGEDPGAENLQNLTPGYYLKTKANKTAEWIKVYVNAQYGFVLDGKPVYPSTATTSTAGVRGQPAHRAAHRDGLRAHAGRRVRAADAQRPVAQALRAGDRQHGHPALRRAVPEPHGRDVPGLQDRQPDGRPGRQRAATTTSAPRSSCWPAREHASRPAPTRPRCASRPCATR